MRKAALYLLVLTTMVGGSSYYGGESTTIEYVNNNLEEQAKFTENPVSGDTANRIVDGEGNSIMEKIVIHLWFKDGAKEAAHLYTSIFPDSRIVRDNFQAETPGGKTEVITVELAGHTYYFLNEERAPGFNPAISFLVACDTADEVDKYWESLSEGGTALMELGTYPFSERFGWIQDKFGISWQILLRGNIEVDQKITPKMLFVGEVCGKSEEAMNLYTTVFEDSKEGMVLRYPQGPGPDKEGTLQHAGFTIAGKEFSLMDSAYGHNFSFNESIAIAVMCETQEEIDYYWEKLSAVPEAEQSGWLKDKFGISWMIIPTLIDKLLDEKDEEKVLRFLDAISRMKKISIADLEKAFYEN